MPLYEYECRTCGKVFEVMQKFADSPLTVHEECGGAVERLLSVPALQFKGSGWYITDYARSGNNGKSDDGAKKDGAEAKSGSESSKDKPASSTSSPPASDSKPAS